MLKNRFFLSYWQDAIQKIWNDIPPEYIRAFFIVFVLQLIANAIELTQVPFNADDVSQLITPQGAMVRSGRPALYLLFDFIFNHHYTPPFMGCLGLAAQAAAGLYVARLLNIKDSWLLVIFAAIASMHPYLLDHQSFDSTRLAYPLGSLLTVVACGEILKGGRKGLIGSLLFGLGLLFYQSVIFIMLTTMCLISINQLLEGVQPVEILKRFIPWCLFCLAGLVIYIVGAKAFQYFAGWHTNGRFQAVFTLDFILKQFPLFFQMVKNSFFVSSGYHYFPWSSKILFNLFLVSTIYNLARKGFRAAFLGIILILAVIIIPITPKLILKNGYLPIRTLLCHGFFWGGLAAMSIKYLRERDIPWAVNLTWVAAMTIIFLFT